MLPAQWQTTRRKKCLLPKFWGQNHVILNICNTKKDKILSSSFFYSWNIKVLNMFINWPSKTGFYMEIICFSISKYLILTLSFFLFFHINCIIFKLKSCESNLFRTFSSISFGELKYQPCFVLVFFFLDPGMAEKSSLYWRQFQWIQTTCVNIVGIFPARLKKKWIKWEKTFYEMALNMGFEIKQQHQETKLLLLGHNSPDQWFVLEIQMQKL